MRGEENRQKKKKKGKRKTKNEKEEIPKEITPRNTQSDFTPRNPGQGNPQRALFTPRSSPRETPQVSPGVLNWRGPT